MAFMTHPEHGATNTQDVEAHEKNGWKVSTHAEWMALAGKGGIPGESPIVPGDSPIAQDAPKKRGPKPKPKGL